jgi:hypothetical protein
MKCSGEIVWELGAVLRNVKNAPIDFIGIYANDNVGLCYFACHNKVFSEKLPGALLDISLSKYIRGVSVISRVGYQHCSLAIWISPSEDGQTNIDDKVVEAFNNLEWKW